MFIGTLAWIGFSVESFKFVRTQSKRCSTWKPFVKQNITFKDEKDKKDDLFAVAGQTIAPGTLFPSTVG